MARRTNVLIIGNCQAGLVAESFRKNAFLASRFRTRHHWMELPANQHEQAKRELSECDILLVQDIREWPDYPLRSYVPAAVPIIRFPCLRFASLGRSTHSMAPMTGRRGSTITRILNSPISTVSWAGCAGRYTLNP
jgi:hypothetical protein